MKKTIIAAVFLLIRICQVAVIATALSAFLLASPAQAIILIGFGGGYVRASLLFDNGGSPTYTLTAYIYSDNGAVGPNTVLGTSTNTFDVADVQANFRTYSGG